MHYNIPTYNKLSQYYNLTVAHYGKEVEKAKVSFNQIILTRKKIGPFIYFKENIYQLAKKYDAVLALGDLHLLPYILLGLRKKRKFSLTFWGIGVSASYDKKIDEDRSLDWIRFRIMDKADSLVFYSDYPIKRYLEKGVKREKLFVAHNTVYIEKRIEIPENKNYFLFVGTINKAKKIYDLLNAYLLAYKKNQKIAPLVIIGNGDEKQNIDEWIVKNKLHNNIILKGAIFDPSALCEIYKHAIASISPGQAGLSVLSSMAYGVPFITAFDSITGGERFNIKHGFNGFFYDGQIESLASIIENLSTNIEVVQRMSQNAQNYYFKYRHHRLMIIELRKSIDYALKKKQFKHNSNIYRFGLSK
jgi:glycosyltransferase involved in cell wall biosynthesis